MPFAKLLTNEGLFCYINSEAVAAVEAQPEPKEPAEAGTCVVYLIGGRFLEVRGEIESVMTKLGLSATVAPAPAHARGAGVMFSTDELRKIAAQLADYQKDGGR